MTFTDYVWILIRLINSAIPVVASVGLLLFIWGLAKFITKSGDAKEIANGRKLMFWGIICIFLMVSSFAIISFFFHDLGFTNISFPPQLPQ